MHQSTLRYRKARWLKVAILLSTASVVAYAWHNPQPVANGGSWLGYTLGTIGALLIVWLAWFGVRKRRYGLGKTTLQGWMSAHIYLGLALIFVSTLHTGFQFAFNLHTLAYVLTCVVIASGIFGIIVYVRYPSLLSSNRKNSSQSKMLAQLDDLNRQLITTSQPLAASMQRVLDNSIENTTLGDGIWQQLRGRDYSSVIINNKRLANPNQQRVIDYFSEQIGRHDVNTNAQLRTVIETVAKRAQLLQRLRRDIRIRALLDIWLLVHIPATVALLAALSAHIIVVFLYW